MTRSEFIRFAVLNEISDDFENVDQIILPNVAKLAAQLGLTVSRPEVVEALTNLLRDGWAKAYLPSSGDRCLRPVDGMPSLDRVEEDFETYFYITEAGMKAHSLDRKDWPFDDEGELRLGAHID